MPVDIDIAEAAGSVYDQDKLRTTNNHDFMRQPAFVDAYNRGMKAAGMDYLWHWRVHVGLWASSVAVKLPGDFVECGVNKGFMSSAIMQYLDWNNRDKTFYLLDTFGGLDFRYVSEEDMKNGAEANNHFAMVSGFYTAEAESVVRNFSEWKNVRIIQGAVPETLPKITSDKIAFANIDMNCSPPEIAAMEYLWDRMVPGAMALFDDYAYDGYRPQKTALDTFARERKTSILSMPTGQGLLIKQP
jgi:hypothetical protein